MGEGARRPTASVRAATLVLVLALTLLGGCALVRPDSGKDPRVQPPRSTPASPTTSTTTFPADPEAGAPATWRVDADVPPDWDDTSVLALVARVGCDGGDQGGVLRPGVVLGDDEVVITLSISAELAAGPCPRPQVVPFEVDLGEPIGDRVLVDGTCARLLGTCRDDDGVRWRPPG